MRSLVWFREDLRTHDHPALHHAASISDDGVVGLYLISTKMWLQHDMAACRVEFILRGLQTLSDDLAKFNIPLLIVSVESFASIPEIILKIIHDTAAQTLVFNRQYEVNELKRDTAVEKLLDQHHIQHKSFDDQTILPPTSILTQQGTNYKVFTAYKHAWYHYFLKRGKVTLLPRPALQKKINIQASKVPTTLTEFKSTIDPELWPAGERVAIKQLKAFVENSLFNYATARDFPAMDETSRLSPYLSTGMLSPRYAFMMAFAANGSELDTGRIGAVIWMSELIWRDFYKSILISTPRVAKHRAYQLETEKLIWKFDQTLLDAWQQGKTGIPIIDAAMRQLNLTGWMHNRLRMITAMYFTKNLFFDWRIGEKYFMTRLIDGDLAANNGGWQWCASTGTDASPYFRVFNPVRQSERFDPDGKFIRKYCPELAALSNKEIHQPTSACKIDLNASRKYAIEKFKSLK